MLKQCRARVAAAAASAAAMFLISLTILDIRSPLEALGFIYCHVYPSVGHARSASTVFPRSQPHESRKCGRQNIKQVLNKSDHRSHHAPFYDR
jgi:hypothetical protein